MTTEGEAMSDMLERDANTQSSLLMIVVGASALFWGIVYLLLF